jgi:hypothetical protein
VYSIGSGGPWQLTLLLARWHEDHVAGADRRAFVALAKPAGTFEDQEHVVDAWFDDILVAREIGPTQALSAFCINV